MTTTMTAPTAALPEAGEEEEEKKKGGFKKLLIMILVPLLVGGAAYEMVLKPMLFPPHYKPGQTVPLGKIVSLPQNTINLSDGHLLQVTVAMQLTAPAVATTLAEDDPKFLNSEIAILGSLSMNTVLNPTGRTLAQDALLKSFQHIAGRSEGAQQISAIYFTSFIAQ